MENPNLKSLVLVLGAGASAEVGLPVGAELKLKIARLLYIGYHQRNYPELSGDELIIQSLSSVATFSGNHSEEMASYLAVCKRIRDAMPQAISIDHFIDSHAGEKRIALCGKLAIARAILSAESASSLAIDRSNINNRLDFSGNAKTWFNGFFQLLTENCRITDLPKRLKSIGIITFNYDRCFEHFLFHAIQNYYAISSAEAAEVLANLEIHHPYGMVGKLPWMGQVESIEFGAEPGSDELLSISTQLRTFTEGTDPAVSDINSIRRIVAQSRRLVFLGFAFHRLNMGLLFDQESPSESKSATRIFATAKGISSSDCQDIANECARYTGLSSGLISIRNELTCSALVQDYWRGLSLAKA